MIAIENGHPTVVTECQSYNVYVVDPDEAVRDAVGLYLDSHCMNVYGFEDSHSFFEFSDLVDNGCLLVESELKDMSGLVFLRQVRARGISMPMLLTTSSSDSVFYRYAIEQGVSGVVRKPFVSENLVTQIELLRNA